MLAYSTLLFSQNAHSLAGFVFFLFLSLGTDLEVGCCGEEMKMEVAESKPE